MVRMPLTPADVERGQRLGALLRRARGDRSMLQTALDAGLSPETLRKIETGRVAASGVGGRAAVMPDMAELSWMAPTQARTKRLKPVRVSQRVQRWGFVSPAGVMRPEPDAAVDTLPLVGRDQGWGWVGRDIGAPNTPSQPPP